MFAKTTRHYTIFTDSLCKSTKKKGIHKRNDAKSESTGTDPNFFFEEYGQIRCALNIISKNKAKEVGQFDMLIGATALHYGLTVVTDNIKDFSLMPGVKCVNWVERE